MTPPPRLDLRDILRASLAETGRLATQRSLAASFFRFGGLEIGVRVLGPDPLQRLLAMIAARAIGPAHDAVLLDVIGGPVEGLEGLLPAPLCPTIRMAPSLRATLAAWTGVQAVGREAPLIACINGRAMCHDAILSGLVNHTRPRLDRRSIALT